MSKNNEDNLNHQIARNLKKIRKRRELTLDMLAEITGVSKSMLGQIEREVTSPTITTLWKIATSLHISLTSLLEEGNPNIKIIDNHKITPLLNDEGRFRLYPTFPYENSKKFEMFYIELDPHTSTYSEPHELLTTEYIIVYEGEFNLVIDKETYHLKVGDAIKYEASLNHEYHNFTDDSCKICMLIYYE